MHNIYFENNRITITEDSYREFCALFTEANAAGGLVRNAGGDCLMIFRNGKWDLPKGHQETGEDIKDTALREVVEETGAKGVRQGELICVTDHCYFRDGIWIMKHTWWYQMHTLDDSELSPQTEEGIVRAEWIAEKEVAECLRNTFPSIIEVFEKEVLPH